MPLVNNVLLDAHLQVSILDELTNLKHDFVCSVFSLVSKWKSFFGAFSCFLNAPGMVERLFNGRAVKRISVQQHFHKFPWAFTYTGEIIFDVLSSLVDVKRRFSMKKDVKNDSNVPHVALLRHVLM